MREEKGDNVEQFKVVRFGELLLVRFGGEFDTPLLGTVPRASER